MPLIDKRLIHFDKDDVQLLKDIYRQYQGYEIDLPDLAKAKPFFVPLLAFALLASQRKIEILTKVLIVLTIVIALLTLILAVPVLAYLRDTLFHASSGM